MAAKPSERKRGQKRDHAESRARHRARVREIAELMSNLEWRKAMAENLAAKWKLSLSSVEKYAIEASHVVEDALSDGAVFRAGLRESVLRTTRKAEAKGDYKSAMIGYRLLADLGGHIAAGRSKVEVTGADGGPVEVTQAAVVLLPPLEPV